MSYHVLIAEPNPTRAAVIQHGLEGLADTCHAHAVGDGTEVLDYLFALGKYSGQSGESWPQLLFLNLDLPSDQAIGVLRVLQRLNDAQQQLLPVVIGLSDHIHSQTCEHAIALGIQSLVPIPHSDRCLVSRIRQVARYWLELDQTIVVNRWAEHIVRPVS